MSGIHPEELLLAYRLGMFPMAENRFAEDVLWIRPRQRGILPLENFHVPRRLARTVRADRYTVRVDQAFPEVIRGCAAEGPDREDTWINPAIIEVFEGLFVQGQAHSVETYDNGELVGGLYGLSLAGAFFAESKFSRRTDASKVALVHLAARLKAGGYTLLDAQFPNPHLAQFGAVAVPEQRFAQLLQTALSRQGNFYALDRLYGVGGSGGSSAGTSGSGAVSGASVLQVMTQTS